MSDDREEIKDEDMRTFDMWKLIISRANANNICDMLCVCSIPKVYQEKTRNDIIENLKCSFQDEIITVSNFSTLINECMLSFIVDEYIDLFGENFVNLLKIKGCNITCAWNNRCTVSAGMCRPKRDNVICIELSTKVFRKVLKLNETNKGFWPSVGDIDCNENFLRCILLVIEHEFVHLIMQCFCPECESYLTNCSGLEWEGDFEIPEHSKTFMTILYNTFGQDTFYHHLF